MREPMDFNSFKFEFVHAILLGLAISLVLMYYTSTIFEDQVLN